MSPLGAQGRVDECQSILTLPEPQSGRNTSWAVSSVFFQTEPFTPLMAICPTNFSVVTYPFGYISCQVKPSAIFHNRLLDASDELLPLKKVKLWRHWMTASLITPSEIQEGRANERERIWPLPEPLSGRNSSWVVSSVFLKTDPLTPLTTIFSTNFMVVTFPFGDVSCQSDPLIRHHSRLPDASEGLLPL